MSKAKQLRRFIKQTRDRLHTLLIWRHDSEDGSDPTWLQQFFHFWVLAGQSFVKNRCLIHASALAYTTVLALIPMLAIVMSISSSLLREDSEERMQAFVNSIVEAVVPPAEVTNTLSSDAIVMDTNAFPVARSSSKTNSVGSTNAVGSLTNGVVAQAVVTNGLLATGPVGGTNSVPDQDAHLDQQVIKVRDQTARMLSEFIQNTRSGALGGIGTGALIVMALSMLIRIENTFNDIWGVSQGRSLFMRVVLYWTVISLAPIFLVVGMGLSSTPHLKTTEELLFGMPLLGSLLFQFLPVVVLCFSFSLLYALMPNTQVKWRAALVGGIVAALLWHVNSSLSTLFVSGVVRKSAIYGGLFLIPVFLVGLYLAWAILLFGCQVAYAWQMRVAFLTEKLVDNVNQRGREFVAIRLMTFIGRRYQTGKPPHAITEIAAGLRIPGRLAQEVIQTLVSARLLTEVVGPESGYVPARPLETISCHDILFAMRASQGMDLTESKAVDTSEIYGEFQKIEEAERVAASSVSVRDLAGRMAPPERQLAEAGEQSDKKKEGSD